MSKGEIFQNILCGLAIFLIILAAIVAIFGTGIWVSQHNNEKVQNMTRYCVSHGYSGWSDDGSNRGVIGCVGGRPNN